MEYKAKAKELVFSYIFSQFNLHAVSHACINARISNTACKLSRA